MANTYFNDIWKFDPDINTWTNLSIDCLGSAPATRFGMGLTAANGKLFVFGGLIAGAPCAYASLTAVGRMNPDQHESWQADNACNRFEIFELLLTVLLFFPGLGVASDLFQLDLATLVWKELDTFMDKNVALLPRFYLGFTSIEGNLYVFGGTGSSKNGTLRAEEQQCSTFDLTFATYTNGFD